MNGESKFSKIVFGISVLAILVFVIILGLGIVVEGQQNPEWLLVIVQKHFAAVIVTPLAMIASIVIVSLFKYQSDSIEVEFIGFKFKGAAGPVIMWILVFLSIVYAIKLLW